MIDRGTLKPVTLSVAVASRFASMCKSLICVISRNVPVVRSRRGARAAECELK
jgi:hypothetical protein